MVPVIGWGAEIFLWHLMTSKLTEIFGKDHFQISRGQDEHQAEEDLLYQQAVHWLRTTPGAESPLWSISKYQFWGQAQNRPCQVVQTEILTYFISFSKLFQTWSRYGLGDVQSDDTGELGEFGFNSAPILQRESVDSIQLSRINKSGEVLSCEYKEGWCARVLQ